MSHVRYFYVFPVIFDGEANSPDVPAGTSYAACHSADETEALVMTGAPISEPHNGEAIDAEDVPAKAEEMNTNCGSSVTGWMNTPITHR